MRDECKTKKQLGEEPKGLRLQAAHSDAVTLRALVDGLIAAGMGVVIVGTDYRVVFQNSVLTERFGDLTGAPCYRGYLGRDEPCECCPMKRALVSGKAERAEMTAADGRRYEFLAAPLRAPDGRRDRAVIWSFDVTERARAEEALRRSEHLLRRVLDTTPDCIFVKDSAGRYLLANKAMADLYGSSPRDMVGRTDLEFARANRVGVREAQQFRADDREVLETGRARSVPQESFTLPDGMTRWFQTVKVPMSLADEPDCVLGVAVDITERKQAEEALRESEGQYRSLVEQSLEGIVITRLHPARLGLVNAAAAEMLGYAAEEILALPPDEALLLVHPEDRERLVRTYRDLMEARETAQGYQVRFIRKDGSVCWVQHFANMISLQAQPAFQTVFLNVTDRVLAEQALRKSEERLRSVFEAARNVAFVTTDLEGAEARILDFSPGAEHVFGYSREEVIGQPLAILHLPADVDNFPKVIEAVRQRGGGVTAEVQLVRKSGRQFPALLTVLPIFDDAGNMVKVLGVSIDITERMRAEEALRESEARFRSLFEDAPLGYQSLTSQGVLLHVNPAWLEMLGYGRAQEVVGHWFGEFLVGQDAAHFTAAFEQLAEAGSMHNVEWEMVRQDGTHIIALFNGRAVYDESGRLQHIHCIMQDITARKKDEQRLARRAEILSRQIQERYDMVGESPPMQALYDFIRKVAPTDAGILICGESGTGKEMVARAVHQSSPRSQGPLEIVNCGAIPSALIESELFGHVRGAFTGAVANKPGRFELADGGTLFFDEVTEMSIECQGRLLRAVEEGKVRRVGGTSDQPVDVRLIAATNRDPLEAVAAGLLREDLFYRLDRLRVVVPPLRERGEDIALLADHFLEHCSASVKGKARRFAPQVYDVFQAYHWPGNVRELRNVVERMVILGDGEVLGLELVPDDLEGPSHHDEAELPVEPLGEIERQQVVRAMQEAGGNKSRAARMLGIDRSTLYAKLRRYGVDA